MTEQGQGRSGSQSYAYYIKAFSFAQEVLLFVTSAEPKAGPLVQSAADAWSQCDIHWYGKFDTGI